MQTSHYRHMSFLRGLLLPFVGGVWVVCHHLLSLDGGVQSLSATVKAAQQLAAKCVKHGMYPGSLLTFVQLSQLTHWNFTRPSS